MSEAAKPEKKAKPQQNQEASGIRWPDPEEFSAMILRVMGQTQKLAADFMERNKKMGTQLPIDPTQMNQVFMQLMEKLAQTPEKLVDAQLSFMQDYAQLLQSSLARLSGMPAQPAITPAKNDRRFQDKSWNEYWVFDYLKQSYLLVARLAQEVVQKNIGDIDPKMAKKIDFYTHQLVDAISPSNFWLTNPEVLRTTIETSGENLVKGFENLLNDIEKGGGTLSISMSDDSAFSFGSNIAVTPGKVVFQNELMQLIQYTPLTENVAKTPLLIIPPWINKFYILDLREKNSLVRYLVDQGHTVFCISWRNPGPKMSHINFDDYMSLGILEAAKEVAKITETDKINALGYCIGGTALACALSYLNALGKNRPKDVPEFASASYLVTLTDFSEPGDIGVFMDESQISNVEERMKKIGYLEASVMGLTFALLRANDLVWSFVVNNYLLGRDPFPFDLLTWNTDSTNLPAAMQSFYLRNMYLENKLIQPNGVKMKDVPIDLRSIKTPTFMISTREDHIAPWRSTYAATQVYQGPITFVLGGSGHIAGVINPPVANKYCYWTNPKLPENPDTWLEEAEAHEGSWWPVWIDWLKAYADGSVPARKPGGPMGQIIEDAPGSYVRVSALEAAATS